MIYKQYIKSPLGYIEILATDKAIIKIDFVQKKKYENPNKITEQGYNQLQEYFLRKRKTFNLPLQLKGTPFQKSVWKELSKIPYGTAVSYGDIARKIRNPKASRAVGSANGKNPIAIVIPCHRVISNDGSPGGYSYGVRYKKFLLDLEKIPYKEY